MKKFSGDTHDIRIAVADIGGTCIKSGIWEKGEIHEIRETPTQARLGGAHVMETVQDILSGYHDFQAIGISSAGQVDTEQGSILYANENIPGYTGTNIREILEARFHVPVSVQNDVNSAAAGEACYGAGRGHANFLCLTYGTGVVLVNRWIAEITYGLISLIHIFNPSLVILGGGVMEQEYVISQVRQRLREQLIPSFLNVEVVPAELGNLAGMLGAAEGARKAYLNL